MGPVPDPSSVNVRRIYRKFKGVQGLLATERASSIRPPLRRRLWLWRRGFLSRADALYDPDESTYRDYVTDYQRFVHTRGINGTWGVALSNKLLFHRLMQPFDAQRMTVYGLVRDGTWHSLEDDPVEPRVTDGGTLRAATEAATDDSIRSRNAAQRVTDQLERDGRLVLKWVHGGGGNNVLLCERGSDGYLVNGDRYEPAAFRSLVADLEEYLVCEHVEQGQFSADRYSETPNTLRILTMYDDDRGEPFVAAAIHRIGTPRSEPLDNFSQGGYSAEIDPETGVLGPGARLTGDGDVAWNARHHVTGATIEGARIPGWDRIRQRLLEMAERCSFVPYVGWDVIVTGESGSFTVIEANSYPGLKSIQVHGPLLTDDRVRRFYESHGVA